MQTSALTRFRRRTLAAARRDRADMRWRREAGFFLAAYLVYDAARWISVGNMTPALANAHWVIDFERHAGVAVERSVQGALQGGPWIWLLSNIYLAAQLLVVPGALIWLYRRAPAVYRRLRDTVLATWLIAVPIYALFPVAPPRLAGVGMADTVSAQGFALTGHSTLFYNPVAAVPSLHCGFAFAVGIALAAAARHRLTRALALLWGPVVALAVVATGNHYLFDVAAGLLAITAGYLLGPLPGRLLCERPRVEHGARRQPAARTSSLVIAHRS